MISFYDRLIAKTLKICPTTILNSNMFRGYLYLVTRPLKALKHLVFCWYCIIAFELFVKRRCSLNDEVALAHSIISKYYSAQGAPSRV